MVFPHVTVTETIVGLSRSSGAILGEQSEAKKVNLFLGKHFPCSQAQSLVLGAILLRINFADTQFIR